MKNRFLPSIFLLASYTLFLSENAYSKKFEKIWDIEGVQRVTYIEPFLMIVLQNQDAHAEVKERVSIIRLENKDKDLSKIKESAVIRYYNPSAYSAHKRELQIIKNAKSIQGLFGVQGFSLFTSVYTLNRETGDLTDSRVTYHRQRGRIGFELINKELSSVKQIQERLIKAEHIPEMLIAFSFHDSGVIVYPVYDGLIHINGKKLQFQRFQKRLDTYPRYENSNETMIKHNQEVDTTETSRSLSP